MMADSAPRFGHIVKGRQPSGVEAISKYSFGQRTQTIQMTGKSTGLNMTKHFIHGHGRASQLYMKIPQSHALNGIEFTSKTDTIDTFKIDGDQGQEIKEDHFGGVQKKQLSSL